jgi:predicted phosphatase
MKRNELRDEIAKVFVEYENDVGMSDLQAAIKILAIPEIAEALKLVVIDPHPLQR